MPSIAKQDDEEKRLRLLKSYHILDTLPEDDFDELTFLASQICNLPISLISILDDKREWFKSKVGIEVSEIKKEAAFSAHAIASENDLLIVENAKKDARFKENPLVIGDPSIVFYAGVPLINPEGFSLGTLSVLDNKPRELSEKEIKSLKIIANQVSTQLELRRKINELNSLNYNLNEANDFITKFAKTAAHDLKNPLTSISLSSQIIKRLLTDNENITLSNLADQNIKSVTKLTKLINDMLDYSLKPALLLNKDNVVDFDLVIKEVLHMVSIPADFKVILPEIHSPLNCSSIALEQIFLNLLTNAVRYNDKEIGIIEITFSEDEENYYFTVSDNGMGIKEENFISVFEKNFTLGVIDRFNQSGTGFGLSTVKSLIEKMGGQIKLHSEFGKGSKFEFNLNIIK